MRHEKESYIENLHNVHSSSHIIRVIKLVKIKSNEHAVLIEKTEIYTKFVGKPQGKWSLGRPKTGWGIILNGYC
jgi:hypothetical protein